jgi:exopolysaccharide biosynthesis WecB/TagA/CpsF family protein
MATVHHLHRGGRERDMSSTPPSVNILGVRIDRRSGNEVLNDLRSKVCDGKRTTVMYVNAHTLNLSRRDNLLRRALEHSDFVLNDGVGVKIAGRLNGCRFPENLNGSDFTLRLLSLSAEEGWRTFLIGGEPGVAEEAAAHIGTIVPHLQIVGTRHGFTADPEADAAAARTAEADVVIVALGNPHQELWLDRWHSRTGALLGVGVGAFLDFQAGKVSRAPQWMNRAGIEWLYRLALEPRRLWRRYVIGNPAFLMRVVLDRVDRQRRRSEFSASSRA